MPASFVDASLPEKSPVGVESGKSQREHNLPVAPSIADEAHLSKIAQACALATPAGRPCLAITGVLIAPSRQWGSHEAQSAKLQWMEQIIERESE